MDIKEIYKKSERLYAARFWYSKNGIKKSKYRSDFTTKKDAKIWCVNEKKRLEGILSDKLKVKDYLDQWIKTKEGKLSPTTLNGYKVNIAHIKKHLGEFDLQKIKLLDVQIMLDALSETGLKYRTVKYIYRTLHAALEYAVKVEFITKNISNGIDIREDERKFEAKVYDAKNLTQLLLLLKEIEHPIYPCVLLASMRGLRRGECLGLRWSDVDFATGIMHIKNNYIVVAAKAYYKKVKTKDSERQTSIEGFIADELLELKKRTWQKGIKQEYVCEVDGKQLHPSKISTQLNLFQIANGLPTCRFHDLRHTFAMLQLENGTDLDTLRRLLGHSKISLTSDTYLHQSNSLIKTACAALDNIIDYKSHNKVTIKDEETQKALG